MKIIHQFLKDLSKYHMGIYLIPIIFLCSISSFANGIFYKFNQTNQALKQNAEKNINALINRNFNLKNIANINSVTLDYEFLNTLNFFTPTRYMSLSSIDRCSVYDLLSTDLAKGPSGNINYVIFKYENKDGEIKTHVLKKDIFLSKIGYKQCPKIERFKQQFNLVNIKNLLGTLRIQIPKSYPQCFENFTQFRTSPKAIYICDIIEKIRKLPKQRVELRNMSKSQSRKYLSLSKKVQTASKYNSIIPKRSYQILESMCLNLNSKQNYCDSRLKTNYWSKMVKNKINTESINNFCPKENTNQKQQSNCISELITTPSNCHFSNISSLQPQPDCDQIATALNVSRLYTEYKDCPGSVGHEGITQYSRLLSHFDNKINEQNKTCYLNSTTPVARFDKEFLDSSLWNVKLCYDDVLKRKEICTPVVMGDSKENDLSFSKVVGDILNRLKGFNNKQQSCKIVTSTKYTPALLKYKTGCYIIKEAKDCDAIDCKFKIMLGETEFNKATLKSDLNFDLFPNSFANENKSMLKLVQLYQQKKTKAVRNVSTFKHIYKNHLNAIYAGIGCAESLLPQFFKSTYLNQCTLTPFIADGIIESEGSFALTVRTSFDNIHAPRIIPWQYVYQSILQYKMSHPLNIWSFYALF